jgi:transposase
LEKDIFIRLQEEQINKLLVVIDLLKQQVIDQQSLNEKLLEQVSYLTARVTELENNQKKNSGNSSKPPSTDIGKAKRTMSLRESSNKKPGGQPGHKGSTLEFRETPDLIIVHPIESCEHCGQDLRLQGAQGYESRQVFDLPPIKLQVTEHRGEIKSCPCCKAVTRAAFPARVTHQVQYGLEIQKLAVYFSNYQLLPYKRTSDMFEDLLGHRINESSLVSMNQRCADSLAGFIRELKKTIAEQPVIHADETGYYYNGVRNWLHVLTTEQHTLYMPHAKRGTAAMDAMGILASYKGRLVHDFWKPYLEYDCAHALCNVHHLRDLTFCAEVENSPWAPEMIACLLSADQLVEQEKQAGKTALSSDQLCHQNQKYDELIKAGWDNHPPPEKQKGKRGAVKKSKTQNLIQRFEQHKEQVLAFMNDFKVPFGNNLAEQAIRMMKVKQKISGCFRSELGANTFATIRSYLSTMQKQGVTAMGALHNAFSGCTSLNMP